MKIKQYTLYNTCLKRKNIVRKYGLHNWYGGCE